jgi:hypothetical protein
MPGFVSIELEKNKGAVPHIAYPNLGSRAGQNAGACSTCLL